MLLVEMAIGDAYGAGFEYAPAEFVARYNDLTGYVAHPRHDLVPGSYTDDTQMAIAVSEALLADEAWTPQRLADRFVAAFHRDPRPGYAQGFHQLLTEVRSGADLLERVRPHSDKSGAAMRAPPIGVLPDTGDVRERACVQASITHHTVAGMAAAQAAALMLHFTYYRRGRRSELPAYLGEQLGGNWAPDWSGKVGAKGWMAVKAALRALVEGASLADVLRRCVAFTGDSDTVAAIAMPAAACAGDMPNDLPRSLYGGLENGAFGRDYLQALGQRLLGRMTSP